MFFKKLTAVAVAAALFLQLTPLPLSAGEADVRTIRFAVMTDLHYIPAPAAADRDNVEKAGHTELRLMAEADAVLSQALRDAAQQGADGLLLCGDLTSNGEKEYAQALADKLAQAAQDFPAGLYVMNGNHDINNSFAALYRDGAVTAAERMDAEEFKTVFGAFGYGGQSRFFPVYPPPHEQGRHSQRHNAPTLVQTHTPPGQDMRRRRGLCGE